MFVVAGSFLLFIFPTVEINPKFFSYSAYREM
jgi:hypothetical protein